MESFNLCVCVCGGVFSIISSCASFFFNLSGGVVAMVTRGPRPPPPPWDTSWRASPAYSGLGQTFRPIPGVAMVTLRCNCGVFVDGVKLCIYCHFHVKIAPPPPSLFSLHFPQKPLISRKRSNQPWKTRRSAPRQPQVTDAFLSSDLAGHFLLLLPRPSRVIARHSDPFSSGKKKKCN